LSFLFMIINLSLYTGTFSFLNFAFFTSTHTSYLWRNVSVCWIAYYTDQGLKTNCPRSYSISDWEGGLLVHFLLLNHETHFPR
jgi:hypothetical protein